MVAAGFVVVIVAALSWIVLLSGSNRVGGESADPAVMDVLPVDFSPATLWRVERRRSPSVMKLTIELSNATETILVYPAYPAAGDTPPVEQPFLIIGDTVSDVDRLTPVSVQPDSCVDTCTVVLRLGDAHDVHVFTDGDMRVVQSEAERIPSQRVVNVALDDPVGALEDVTAIVCVSGLELADGGGIGRSITLQRRRRDQVGVTQVALVQSTPWPLHRSGVRPECQAEFALGIEHWGGAKPVERFDSVVVNVVHWGEFALDMEAVRVAVSIER